MNRFPMYIWVVFLFLSLESLLHISFVYSAPVNSYDPSKKIITRILDMDEKLFEMKHQFVSNNINPGHVHGKTDMEKEHMDKSLQNPLLRKGFNQHGVPIFRKAFLVKEYRDNSQGHILLKKGADWKDSTKTDVDVEEANAEPNKYVKDRSLQKKGTNWNEVLHNRPLLAEVLSLCCLSFLFAVSGGAAVWLIVYTQVKREENRELDDLAEKLKSLKSQKELDKWELQEPFPKATEKEKEFKALLHSVLKTERKKKRRKKRRSDSGLDLTRREEMFTQKKRSESLGVNTQDMKMSNLNEKIREFQKVPEKENKDKKKMQDAKGKNQVQLSSELSD
ncbi:uncharacterized protein [Notamacropus eugenii]|uniref:uncharacterized protein n=1 Tax=Notamacropus eugenii TaxID=9315 RepID=UPI003B67C060